LAAGDVSPGHYRDGIVLPVHGSLRENIEDEVIPMMIYLTAAVAVFLFVYLVVALVRPEWF
jgi:K+-transporting ATPase KdpF subunit